MRFRQCDSLARQCDSLARQRRVTSSTARTWSWRSTAARASRIGISGARPWTRFWRTSIFSPVPGLSNQLPMVPGSTTTLWALGDSQNSVRDVVTDSGALEQHIAYGPFGQQVSGTGLTTTGSVVPNFAFGYTGTYTDPATGLQLHGRRWYNPNSPHKKKKIGRQEEDGGQEEDWKTREKKIGRREERIGRQEKEDWKTKKKIGRQRRLEDWGQAAVRR